MRIRTLTPFVLALTVACGGADMDDAAMAENNQEYAADEAPAADPAAEVAAVAEFWQTHFNMGHGSMVADKYVENAINWNGSGTMVYGREAIAASLQGQMDAASPQIELHQQETLMFGDFAMTRGHFVMNGTVDGTASTNSGYYMSFAENVDGEWMLRGGVSNFDSDGQMVAPGEMMEMPAGEGADLVQERGDFYKTHFNMGHASMVAETYSEDAVLMMSGTDAETGRAAAEARLQGMVEAGVQIDHLTTWSATQVDENHVTGVGTYNLEGPDGAIPGHFAALYERGEDGTLLVKWLHTANHPSGM